MFIETHKSNINGDITLAFIKSANVQAYPCGRRRSSDVSYDINGGGDKEVYRIPFDPEARLNTEANNRNHSGLNGFTQTYLKDWDSSNNVLTVSLGGYLFNITLPSSCTTENAGNFAFNATAFVDLLKANVQSLIDYATTNKDTAAEAITRAMLSAINSATKLYANILIEEVHLFSSDFREYFTNILRDQTVADVPLTSIDVIASSVNITTDFEKTLDANNYYFSGLSFSTTPLTGTETTRSCNTMEVVRGNMPDDKAVQTAVSLCILERETTTATWKIHQPALLPKIEHGTIEGSIAVPGEAFFRSKITAKQDIIAQNNINVTGNVTVATQTKTKTLTVDETITATAALANNAANMTVNKAKFTEIKGDDINQKVGNDYYDVPVMFLDRDGSEYKLRISRVNKTF